MGTSYLGEDEVAMHVATSTRAGQQAGFHVVGDQASARGRGEDRNFRPETQCSSGFRGGIAVFIRVCHEWGLCSTNCSTGIWGEQGRGMSVLSVGSSLPLAFTKYHTMSALRRPTSERIASRPGVEVCAPLP